MKKFFAVLAMVALIAVPITAMANDGGEGTSAEAGAYIFNDSHDDNRSKVEGPRYLPNPGIVPLPNTNGFFTAPTPDSSFRSIREIVKMDDPNAVCLRVTEGTLESWAKGGDTKPNYQLVREPSVLARGNKAENDVRWLDICIETPKGFVTAALVDNEADDGDTNMLNVLGKAGSMAAKDGVTTLVITAEGAHRSVEASGWGIGLYMLGSDVSKGGSTAGIMGGGTGYASNETQTEDNPWFQGKAGMVK